MATEVATKPPSNAADSELDWEALRARSAMPHGFGEERVRIWPKLLHIDGESSSDDIVATGSTAPHAAREEHERADERTREEQPHEDERQIGLDTDRSFVLYPDTARRETLQAGLNRLIVSVFRRRPRLHYFQGYHDIVSVLFLTLPEELHFPVTEKVSLHRVRDSMGTTLEPVVGLLRILKRILHLADEEFAAILDQAAPLPYYALSNLLTLFSHDVPTLPLIQHIFDYLLSRPPIAVVYLAAALTLTRREEVLVLEEEGEEGMMHSLLTGLPELYEEEDPASSGEHSVKTDDAPKEDSAAESEARQQDKAQEAETDTKIDGGPGSDSDLSAAKTPDEAAVADARPTPAKTRADGSEGPPLSDTQDDGDQRNESHPRPEVSTSDASRPETNDASPPPEVQSEPAEEDVDAPGSSPIHEKASTPRTASPDAPRARPRVSLTALLTCADALYARFPPTHPGVAVASIMGPQSAMLTWSERREELPDDDEAELMVTRPELVVRPYAERGEDADEEDEELASDAASSGRPSPARGAGGRRGKREKESEREKEKERRRRRLRKPRRLTDIVVQRRTMVAGAVLVLGVAMAVYGYNAGLPGGGGGGHHRSSGFGREWRRVGSFLGGALMGAGERVFEGLRRGL